MDEVQEAYFNEDILRCDELNNSLCHPHLTAVSWFTGVRKPRKVNSNQTLHTYYYN
jgi:hypothetical protein